MEGQEQTPNHQQAPIIFETLSDGRKEMMRYLFETSAEQTAILGAASQKHIAICNLGGIAALLAFAGTKGLDTAGMMVHAFYAFSVGLVLISVSMGCSYHITARLFRRLLDDLLKPAGGNDDPTGKAKKTQTGPTCFQQFCKGMLDFATYAATPLAWMALVAFVVGMVFGGIALDHLPTPSSKP